MSIPFKLVNTMQEAMTYTISHEAKVPDEADLNLDTVLSYMDTSPESFIYVDFLGSTYTFFAKKLEDGRQAPQVVAVSGPHFSNIVRKYLWAFAEETLWDLYDEQLFKTDGGE